MSSIAILLPNLCGGGAERVYVYLANDWLSRGFSVEFILMHRQGELLPLLGSGVTVTELYSQNIRSLIVPLASYLRKARPDVLLASMWSLTSAAVISWVLSGKVGRLFLSDHEHLTRSYLGRHRVKPSFLTQSIRFTYPFADGIIAVSRGVKDDLCALGNLSDKKVCVIYNPAATGVSPDRISSAESEKLWGRGFNNHILAVGRLSEEKDFKTLIRAFALLSKELHGKLVILGEGPLREELKAFVTELGLDDCIALPGFVRDTYPMYRSADLFVLSSLWEGFGNVIVEALECGVPVVSTNCPGGPSEILEDGRYGKLVPVGDPVALAAAMVQSLSEQHDRAALRLRAQDFSVRKISDQYLSYLFPESL
jgi:glycosyltransferase involved in cell wall biosynthesis